MYVSLQSTTAFGRMMIELTKNTVEAQYTTANGYKADAKVSARFVMIFKLVTTGYLWRVSTKMYFWQCHRLFLQH